MIPPAKPPAGAPTPAGEALTPALTARGAATLILRDDNFAATVNGIEEGRGADDNVRKVTWPLLATGAAEVLLFFLAILTGLPLPLTPVQLLWLNLVTNGIQDVALTLEEPEPDVLERDPRPPDQPPSRRTPGGSAPAWTSRRRATRSCVAGSLLPFDEVAKREHLASTGGGFQEAIERRGGVKAIRCLAARRYPDVRIQVELHEEGDAARWEYEVAFNQSRQRRPELRQERVLRDGEVLLDRPNEEDRSDPARLTQTYLEQVNFNRECRGLAEFLASIRYLHIVPQLVREPDRSLGRSNDPFGGDFLERLATTRERVRNARLKAIQKARCVAVPQIQAIELWRDARGTRRTCRASTSTGDPLCASPPVSSSNGTPRERALRCRTLDKTLSGNC